MRGHPSGASGEATVERGETEARGEGAAVRRQCGGLLNCVGSLAHGYGWPHTVARPASVATPGGVLRSGRGTTDAAVRALRAYR
jgi:hypothetical protein